MAKLVIYGLLALVALAAAGDLQPCYEDGSGVCYVVEVAR